MKLLQTYLSTLLFEFRLDIPLPLLCYFFAFCPQKLGSWKWFFSTLSVCVTYVGRLSVDCFHMVVFLVILQKSDCGYRGFTCPLKPWHSLSHISPAILTCIRSHRPPALHCHEFTLPMCLSNEISLFRLNSRCCSVSWWCLHGQFVPIFPRNGPPLPGPAEGQWGQHCQPGLRNGRQLHCYQHSQQ